MNFYSECKIVNFSGTCVICFTSTRIKQRYYIPALEKREVCSDAAFCPSFIRSFVYRSFRPSVRPSPVLNPQHLSKPLNWIWWYQNAFLITWYKCAPPIIFSIRMTFGQGFPDAKHGLWNFGHKDTFSCATPLKPQNGFFCDFH